MNDAQLIERLHRADAYGVDTAMPETIWTADRALREIERRMGMTDQTTDRPATRMQRDTGAQPAEHRRLQRWRPPGPRRGLFVALAAAVIVLIVGVIVIVPTGGGEPPSTQPDTTTVAPTTTAAPTTTTAAATTTTAAPTTTVAHLSSDELHAIADSFFAAYNSGDVDGLVAMLAPDATLRWQFDTQSDETIDREEWIDRLVWNLAQGTQYAEHSCVATDGQGYPAEIVCDTANRDAPVQAGDLEGVATELSLFVGEDGLVVDLLEHFDGFFQRGRFDIWMQTTHPGVLDEVDFGGWSDRDEARADGIALAGYATEWGDFLEANGCDDSRFPCAGI